VTSSTWDHEVVRANVARWGVQAIGPAAPAAESPHTATANSPTPTTSHGNDERWQKAGDHQRPDPKPAANSLVGASTHFLQVEVTRPVPIYPVGRQ